MRVVGWEMELASRKAFLRDFPENLTNKNNFRKIPVSFQGDGK